VGIGFVLIVWALLLAVLTAPVVLVLLLVAKRTGGPARMKRVLRWVAVAAPLGAAYAGAGFLAYALWCSEVRGVDPGIGDWATVPLGEGFSLTFLDDPGEAFIPERHKADGVPLESGITHVGQTGRYVYGLEGADSAFVLDTRSGALHRSPRQGLPAALREVGVASTTVAPVGEFYTARRWGWPDLAAAAALVTPVLLVGGRSARRMWAGVDARVA
jgi:hypothetical protein